MFRTCPPPHGPLHAHALAARYRAWYGAAGGGAGLPAAGRPIAWFGFEDCVGTAVRCADFCAGLVEEKRTSRIEDDKKLDGCFEFEPPFL